MRKTKIVCTLGPATDDPELLKKLMHAGMNVARINFSHGNYQDQEERINVFKWIRGELGFPIPLLLDTQGPEIRIGKFKEEILSNINTNNNIKEGNNLSNNMNGDAKKKGRGKKVQLNNLCQLHHPYY